MGRDWRDRQCEWLVCKLHGDRRTILSSHAGAVLHCSQRWCKENPRLLCLNFVDTQAVDALERSFLRGDLTIDKVEKHLDGFRSSDD